MNGSSPKRTPDTNRLTLVVVALAVVVMGLGAAVVVLQLRPDPPPRTASERNITLWTQTVEENPDAGWARIGLGVALFDAQQLGDAERELEEGIRLEPSNWSGWMHLGLIVSQDEPTVGETYLEEAARLAPRTSKVLPLIALGDHRFERGDYDGARSAYEDAISDMPVNFDAHFGLARTLEKLGDIDGALERYLRANDFDPDNSEVKEALTRLEQYETSTSTEPEE